MLALFLGGLLSSPVGAASLTAEDLTARGHALYFEGRHAKAVESYVQAVRLSSSSIEAWLSGGVVLEETGQPRKAARWYERAAELSGGAGILSALGWARYRSGDLGGAREAFQQALARDSGHPYALLGLARIEIESSRPQAALALLERARKAAPLLNLVPYYQGRAYELLGEEERAAQAYREAVRSDAYFIEGRDPLARASLREKNYQEAWRHLSRILDAEPHLKRFQALLRRIRPRLSRGQLMRPSGLHRPIPYLAESEQEGPLVRVGIETDSLGRPRPRQSVGFQASSDFLLVDARGRKLAEGRAEELWQARLRRFKKSLMLVVSDPTGRIVLVRQTSVLIRPKSPGGFIALKGVRPPADEPSSWMSGRLLRGEVELALFGSRLRIVNILDLESYTHGVLSAEMPISSPLEALKTQAVLARTHALRILQVTRRHRRQGYDLCDQQHCQVYEGLRAESPRSREIVSATRGRIVTYVGRPAHTIYFSNCGGTTQSGRELNGWGDLPYWTGIADGKGLGPPRSPWELREHLLTWPSAYCQPSNHTHPSLFRWKRLIPFKDLEEKLDRRLRIGRLLWVRPLRRSRSGNVNSLLVQGSRRAVRLDSEMQIRSLLGIGALRSTLFFIETEYGPKARPQTLVFHGGGWGHGVGLCQSGSIGRAESGHGYEEILKAYFPGTELGRLPY